MKSLLLVLTLGLFTFTSASQAGVKVKPDPLQTCFISGEKLGEMGDPVVFVYQGQEIKLCCKDCKEKFDQDPVTYLKKYQAAVGSKVSGGSTSTN